MSVTSLSAILKKDPILNSRIVEQVKEVKKSQKGLKDIASSYNKRYWNEVQEGTKKQQLLLEDGKRRGLNEEEIVKRHGFIPTIRTPILNYLYFLMNEYREEDEYRNRRMSEIMFGNNAKTREEYDEEIGRLLHENIELKNTPEMETFIYGNMTHEEFKRIKKLKRLSKSDNENEAFLAYSTCMKLCRKYGLDFDKIPI